MSLAIGIAAFLLEGLVFQLLQEPELLSNMGYLGKYVAELFRGSTVLMSTVLSLVLVFLPLFFPARFKDSSAVPASYVWIAAVLCLLFSGYSVWRRDRIALEINSEAAPHMDIRVHNAVPHSRTGDTATDVFFYVELVLEGPSRVSISNFSLAISDQGQSATNIAIDDIPEWQWIRGGNFRDLVDCMPLPNDLPTRGHPVRGWVHFKLPTLSDMLIRVSLFTLNVNCEHGTCYRGIDGAHLSPDEQVKGMMWKRPKTYENT
jgi:hypothetical protein